MKAAALSPLYPAPSEARAKRSGGTGFYKDRGLHRPKQRFEERDQHRPPDAQQAAALGRALTDLAQQHPRFKESLNRLRHHVLVQVRSPAWKRRAVLKCLSNEPIDADEIIEETGLDLTSVSETLELMLLDRHAQQCTRSGGPLTIRRDGKPSEKVYWRKC